MKKMLLVEETYWHSVGQLAVPASRTTRWHASKCSGRRDCAQCTVIMRLCCLARVPKLAMLESVANITTIYIYILYYRCM